MPTFLTTSKMDPALAARIEASVRGREALHGRTGTKTGRHGGTASPTEPQVLLPRRPQRSAAQRRRIVSVLRLVLVVTVALGVYNIVVARRESRRALEHARTSLLESVRVQSASLPSEDHGALSRTGTWLAAVAGPYEGDLVDPVLHAPGSLASTLARPLVYVRGSTEALGNAATLTAAAAASTKDALVLCLLEPPDSRSEKALLDKVRVAYAGGWNFESRTPNVHRLHEIAIGLPLLLPPWSERVRAADDASEVARLRAELERAPIERAKQAAAARLLLVTLDEPGDANGATELDGERVHPVRVVLVDLAASKVLLRSRHVVDPAWITPARRATYASGLDSCLLALDVREDVRKAAGTSDGAPSLVGRGHR